MGSIRSHRDLFVWQRAMDLAVEVYRLTARFPRTEAFALSTQFTRAAASVPANVAEGHGRHGRKSFANFLAIAKGSLMKVQTYLALAGRLSYITADQAAKAEGLISEVSKMLTALRNRLRAKGGDPSQ